MSFASSRSLLQGLRAQGRLSYAGRLSARSVALPRNSTLFASGAQASVRAFSWGSASSAPPPAEPVARLPEDGFVAEPVPAVSSNSSETISGSSSTLDTSSSSLSDTLSSATSALSDAGASIPDMTSVVAPALQAGDMAAAGLTGWSPAGLACSLLEAVELSTGLGWAGTLALTTVGVRTALLWPQIRSMRAAARIQPYQAQIEKIQAESVAAARAGNMPRAQELSLERASIYQTAGVKVSDMFIAPLTMLPAQLGLFFGVKRMSDLPLPSLAADTWAWLPSLAAADPMWLLPIMNTVAIQATLYMSLKDAPTEKGAHMINAFRVLSLTGLPVMLNFSSAINILILTQSLFGVVQTGILRQAFVRRAVGLPPILNDIKLPTVRDSFGAFQNYLDDVKKQAEAGKR